MNVFLSYARLDRAAVESLQTRLRDLGHDVWLDERLVGGEEWWDVIIERIRWCHVFVIARSANYERSKVCLAERRYAEDVDRVLLPVRVGGSAEDLDGLGSVDTVDWRTPGERRVAQLAAAIPAWERLKPLPDILPDVPAIPLVRLDRPHLLVANELLTRADEDEFIRCLRPLVEDPDAGDTVIDLLRRFMARPADVSATGLAEAGRLLAHARHTIRGRQGTSTLQDLRALLGNAVRGDLLPILGFGLTDGLIGSRLTLAGRLARQNSVARLRQLGGDLPGVAQFLLGFHGEQDMRDMVLDEYRNTLAAHVGPDDSVGSVLDIDDLFGVVWERERHPEEPHCVLARLPCPIFVNAHPSGLLARALEDAGKRPHVEHCRWRENAEEWPASVFRRRAGSAEYQPTIEEPLVFHLFGSFQYPETLVLAEDDYLRFLNQVGRREGATASDAIPECVKAAATTSRLLMVGLGLEDLDTRVLMTALIEQEGRAKRRVSSLAVQLDPDRPTPAAEQAREYLKRYFADERRIRMYWGSVEAFTTDLAALRAEVP